MEPSHIHELLPGVINVACPLPGVATAGQPTADQFRELARAGYRTVVDLRLPDEPRGMDEPEPEVIRRAGMEYVGIPVRGPHIPDEPFDELRAVLRDPARRPALVHCATANRVGALLVPYLVLDEGKEPEEAVEIAIEIGLRSRALLDAAFGYIRRHGGERAAAD